MTQSSRDSDSSKHTDKLLIGANEHGVAFIGSKGCQSYERIVPISEFELIESGAIAVESAKLLGVIRTFGNQPVELQVTKETRNDEKTPTYKMVVKSGRSRININEVVSADEVPKTSIAMKDSQYFQFSISLLKEMLQAVKPSLNEDCSHASMRCLQLKVSGTQLSVSTVDGYRLGIAKCNLNTSTDQEIVALIPVRVVDIILSLNSETDPCSIHVSRSAMAIQVGSLKFQTSLIDIKFPDLNQVLPKETVGGVVISAKPFIEVLERCKIAVDVSSTGKSNIPPRIKIKFASNGVMYCESIKDNSIITQEEFLTENTQITCSEDLISAYDYNFLQQAMTASKAKTVACTLAYPVHGCGGDPVMILITPIDPSKRFTLLSLINPQRF